MEILRRLSWAYLAGCVGTLGFFVGLHIGLQTGLMKPPEQVFAMLTSKGFFYKQVVWGGVWGLLFVIPAFKRQWWVRGPIVGALATAAALFYFRATLPPPQIIVGAIILNVMFWGLTAGLWHDRVMLKK